MFNFLKPSPDATKLVPKEKVAGEYRKRQAGVLVATCVTYLSDVHHSADFHHRTKADHGGVRLFNRSNWADFINLWDWLRGGQAVHGGLSR